jgi:hypothetical protein
MKRVRCILFILGAAVVHNGLMVEASLASSPNRHRFVIEFWVAQAPSELEVQPARWTHLVASSMSTSWKIDVKA